MTKRAVIEASKKKYMVMETKKFNVDGSFKYAPLDSFNGIVTEEKPSEEIINQLKKYNLDLIF